ncbi:MAG: hypothetical protein NTY32_11235 [Bacteroidia bacterium]|nr:hypothetical protein [Bacteroidia bacterium]
MNTQNIEKRAYRIPAMEQIKLDNEISLALESIPPIGPLEGALYEPDLISNDPVITSF